MVWHWAFSGTLGLVAGAWVLQALEVAWGLRGIPKLKGVAPIGDAECPRVSILFAGRDEAEKVGAAVESFLSVDYPNFEVVAVNDRSEDATQQILERAAARDARLKVIHVTELPTGWLGKTHGLQKGFEASTGEWLVFTDADVKFSPDLLRRAVGLAKRDGIDHLPLFGYAETYTFGERVLMTFFALSFALGTKPWKKGRPGSRFYVGIGAFQMVRRTAYVAIGEHKRLAMEVVDDIKLGKLMQDGGFRSQVAIADRRVSVHWHQGVAATIRGTTKNFFATSQYSVATVTAQVAAVLLGCILPWVAIFFVHGWAMIFAAVAVGVGIAMQAGVTMEFEVSPLYALTMPAGALLLCWMLIRSTFVTLRDGGITWRGTFYRLSDLRKGMV
ncbi:MAG: glycosyltransferase family 2 protein [Candidatus Acidiferrales bacterium]